MKIYKRYLVSDQTLIEQLSSQFERINRDNINWKTTYLDTETGDNWLYYFTDTELHGGGYPMMSKLPFPDTEKLIEIALTSDKEDEVFAACRTLINNEKIDNQEFRSTLINKLELISDSSRQRKVIKAADLDSPMNMKSQLLKSADQISRDAADFLDIAERAKRLLE